MIKLLKHLIELYKCKRDWRPTRAAVQAAWRLLLHTNWVGRETRQVAFMYNQGLSVPEISRARNITITRAKMLLWNAVYVAERIQYAKQADERIKRQKWS